MLSQHLNLDNKIKPMIKVYNNRMQINIITYLMLQEDIIPMITHSNRLVLKQDADNKIKSAR
ncbi:orf5 [Artaxa digramma nucleopolyhedrovirus]|uniref:Orf5 n=1 Tax=Artaxa digramma nucleopolyhedrovirus TaxID=3070910 RepID=A0AAE6R6R0_9ABAC|nr:orf5 [Euproctis digramma nucleopolyhedrovirus]QHB21664.1 orf5 [Artaxa digramma nucleopolyhedrovirus]